MQTKGVTVEGNDVAAEPRTDSVASPRAMRVYPETEVEARRMIDQLRDAVRLWMATAKILFDDNADLAAKLSKHEAVKLRPLPRPL